MTTKAKEKRKPKLNQVDMLNKLVISVVVLAIATAINYVVVFSYEKTTNVSGVFLLSIIIVSALTGEYFWGIMSAVYSVVATNFFFLYPFFAFDFSLAGYPLTFLVMMATSMLTCALTVNMHQQRDKARWREKMAYLMNEMDRMLLRADTKEEIITLLMENLHVQVERPVIYLEHEDSEFVFLEEKTLSDDLMEEPLKRTVEEKYLPEYYRNARKSIIQRHVIIDDLDPVRGDGVLCIPILWQEKIFGTICIILGEDALTDEVQRFAQGLINHFAIAFDHQELREEQQRILMEKQEEQLRGSLLRSISHDLRTPLTGIIGASGAILENESRMQPEQQHKLMIDINEEAHWLLRMIENVLSVTKIGNRGAKLKKLMEPVEEVIADSVVRCKKYHPGLKVTIHQPDELLMIPMDPILIRQVVTNLLDNAYRHGSSEEKIELTVTKNDACVAISVQDYGQGMAEEDLQHVFRGLGRRRQQDVDSSRGLGLGVSICKTIVEAHDGQLFAENIEGKGLKVTFCLPIGEEA